jgi:uncharacterized RDD family membrane protein YckC
VLRRLAALLYDGLLLLGVAIAAASLALVLTRGQAVPAGNLLFRVYLTLVAFLYFAVPWTRTGQTLGLKAWRLRVETSEGTPLTWRHALLRFLIGIPSVGLLGLGLLWAWVDRDGLALHDRGSGTRVVRCHP